MIDLPADATSEGGKTRQGLDEEEARNRAKGEESRGWRGRANGRNSGCADQAARGIFHFAFAASFRLASAIAGRTLPAGSRAGHWSPAPQTVEEDGHDKVV